MTKKDYTKIAGAVNVVACNYCGDKTPQEVLEMVVATLAEILKQDNEKFDKDMFYQACFKI